LKDARTDGMTFSTEQTAQLIADIGGNVSARTLRRWRREGLLSAQVLDRGRLAWPLGEVVRAAIAVHLRTGQPDPVTGEPFRLSRRALAVALPFFTRKDLHRLRYLDEAGIDGRPHVLVLQNGAVLGLPNAQRLVAHGLVGLTVDVSATVAALLAARDVRTVTRKRGTRRWKSTTKY